MPIPDTTVDAMANAIKTAESGGKYDAQSKDGGYGAYQFMPDTWELASKAYAGQHLEPTPENQDAVAKDRIGKLFAAGYSPQQIASIWNSGNPDPQAAGKGINKTGVAYDTPQYVNKVMKNLGSQRLAESGDEAPTGMPVGGDPFNNPYFKSLGYVGEPQTAQDVVKEFAGSGMTIGQAMNQYYHLKDIGAINKLPGEDELSSNYPSAPERFIKSAAYETAKPLMWLGSWMAEAPNPMLQEAGDLFNTGLSNIENEQEKLPPGWATTLGDMAGYQLGAEMLGPLAEGVAGAVAPKLAFVGGKVRTAVDALDAGASMDAGLEAIGPAVASAKKWEQGIKLGVQYGANDLIRGQTPLMSLAFPFAAEGVKYATKFGPIGKLAARLGFGQSKGVNNVLDFIAQKTGQAPQTVDEVISGLRAVGAPAAALQEVYKAGTQTEWGDVFAKYVGNKAANGFQLPDGSVARLNPDELRNFVGSVNKRYTDQTMAAYDEALGGLRGTSEDISSLPKNTAKWDVVETPVQHGGVDMYFPPQSRWAQTRAALGKEVIGPGDRVVSKQFDNPLVVDFKANELPAEAALQRLQGNPKLAAEAAYMANKAAANFSTDTQPYNDILLNLAGKVAQSQGYGAIYFRHASDATKDIVMDLSHFNPDVKMGTIADEFENRIQRAASTLFHGVPGALLAIGGAGLAGGVGLSAMTPQESDAGMVNFELLGKLLKDAGGDLPIADLLGELSAEGDHTTAMALAHIRENTPIWSGAQAVDKLKEVQDAIKANPDAPLNYKVGVVDSRVPNDKFVDVNIHHPDVPFPIATVNGTYRMDTKVFDPVNISGAAPGILGYSKVKAGLMAVNEAVEGATGQKIGRVEDALRLTGVRENKGFSATPVSFRLRNLLLPAAIGMAGGTLYADKSQAGLMPPEELGKLIEGGLDEAFPSLNRPTQQVIKMIQAKNPAAEAGEVAAKYTGLMNDLDTGNNLQVSGDKDSSFFTITHPTTEPFPVATINGSIDPDTGTWYADLKQAKDFGFGKSALQNVFNQAKTINPAITKLGGKLVGLAALSAAMYGIYDQFGPSKAEGMEIPPISEFLGRGIKGAADDIINDYAGATSSEAISKITASEMLRSTEENKNINTGNVGMDLAAQLPQNPAGDGEAKRAWGMLQANNGLKGLPSIRPFFDQSDDPAWQQHSGQFTRMRDRLITGRQSVYNQLIQIQRDQVLAKNGVDPQDLTAGSEFIRASEGIKMGPDGKVGQTETTPIAPNIAQAAQDFEDWVVKPSFELQKGVRIAAHEVAAKYGLPDTPETWQKMKWVQDEHNPYDPQSKWQGSLPKQSDIAAAREMKGMLQFGPTSDLDLKYKSGQFLFNPVQNQVAKLTDTLKEFTLQYGDRPPPDIAATMETMQNYLKQLQDEDVAMRVRRAPLRDVLARKQYWGGLDKELNVPPEVKQLIQETDLSKVMGKYTYGLMNKMFWDDQLYKSRQLAKMYQHGFPSQWFGGAPGNMQVINKNGALADQLVQNMNYYRGLGSVWEDRSIANFLTSVWKAVGGKKTFGIPEVRSGVDDIMKFMYLTKLGGLRFPIQNLTQPLLTTIALGSEHFANGLGKTWGNYEKAQAEAEMMDLLKEQSGGRQEISQSSMSKLAKFVDWLPSVSENFNRVLTFQVGKDYALKHLALGDFNVPSFVKFFDDTVMDGKHSAEDVANAFGAAWTRTTQFVFSSEGRPLVIARGSLTRMAGQFKSFGANYAIFMKNLFKHGVSTGEWAPFVRASTGLITLGGGTSAAALFALPTAFAGFNLYDETRNQLIKDGYDFLPRGSLLGAFADWSLLGTGLVDSKSMVGQGLQAVQLSSTLDPFNFPTDPSRVPSWFAGPTIGGAYDLAQSLGKTITGKQPPVKFGSDVARTALGPVLGGSVPDALQMAGQFGAFFDKIGYRGGSYSPTGRSIANQPGATQVIARGLNLQPTIQQGRWMYLNDIQHALEGGQTALADKYKNEAIKAGYIVDKKDMAGIQAQVTAAKRKIVNPNIKP